MICFERVRDLREEQEYTQKDIANFLGVDKSTYAAWERGRDLFPLRRLNALCNFYNVSLDYITNLSEQKKYPDLKKEIDPPLLKERVKEIRKEFNYTQEKLALELNTTHSAISAYENGHLIMPLIFLYQTAKIFQISMDYILGKTNNKYLNKDIDLIKN